MWYFQSQRKFDEICLIRTREKLFCKKGNVLDNKEVNYLNLIPSEYQVRGDYPISTKAAAMCWLLRSTVHLNGNDKRKQQ
jgi:hypothetical protein